MEILVVVDMQNDFIDGSLGTKEAQAIVPNVVKKIKEFNGDAILYTMDTHLENYLTTQEGRNLLVEHCILRTKGWEINPDVIEAINSKNLPILRFEKRTFGSNILGDWIRDTADTPTKITFVGLCTGICVISNAIIAKANAPEAEIVVDASCCACVTPDSHNTALKTMKLCQITIENWEG